MKKNINKNNVMEGEQMNAADEIAEMKEERCETKDMFFADMQNNAHKISQAVLTRQYGQDYASLIMDAVHEVDELADREYHEYLEKCDPDWTMCWIAFREHILMRAYHLYMANIYFRGYVPTEYSVLCKIIRQATELFKEKYEYDADVPLRFPSLFSLIEHLKPKYYQGDNYSSGCGPDTEDNVVVAHLRRIWIFCDILESLPEYMSNVKKTTRQSQVLFDYVLEMPDEDEE